MRFVIDFRCYGLCKGAYLIAGEIEPGEVCTRFEVLGDGLQADDFVITEVNLRDLRHVGDDESTHRG